jgi:hypothetical protein
MPVPGQVAAMELPPAEVLAQARAVDNPAAQQ